MALIQSLIQHHGLKAIYLGGLVPEKLDGYLKQVKAIGTYHREDLPAIRKQLAEVRSLSDQSKQSRAIEAEPRWIRKGPWRRLLRIGAVGGLMLDGK